ncbi:hypothetical protein ABI070_15105, partial [Enterococcus faecium]
ADPIGPVKPAEAKAEPVAQLPKIAPVATAPAASSPPAKPAEQKAEAPPSDQPPAPIVTAAIAPLTPAPIETPSAAIVRKTEFGVDLGGANSI